MERITPTEKYYNYFDREENPKFEVSVSLQVYLDNDPGLAEQIAEKESVTLGLLGSATHRNPKSLVEFLKKIETE